jgi:hypothetical protein
MKPYYCVRLEGPTWPSAQQTKLRELVETWLEAEHPFDDRGPGVSIRLDAENPEQWWRYTIDESLNGGAIVSTTITILNLEKKSTFEVRTSVIPGGSRVTPLSINVSLKTKRALLDRVVDTLTLYDAGMKIGTKAALITEPAGAEAIAAFFEAPSRALPIVIETMPSFETSVFEVGKLAPELAGLAHVVQIVGAASRLAFNEFHGRDVLQQQGLVILWPDHTNNSIAGNGMFAGAGEKDRNRVRQTITEIAADSLAILRAPRFRRRSVEQEVETRVVEAEKIELDASGDPETVSWNEYRSALDGWQESVEKVDELEQAMAEADRIIAEKQQLLEKGDQVVDQLVLQNTELAIRLGRSPTGLVATSAIDAVRQAKSMCENLVFHEQALRSAEQIQGIDANRLLQDLVRLNIVAGDWQTGRISNSSLTISCRSFGLNYAAGIGEVAENKYGEDYSFTWRGRTEYAVAHIRNGRGVHLYRVHVFFDDDSHQVVVAYIGRHLRGKRDHN